MQITESEIGAFMVQDHDHRGLVLVFSKGDTGNALRKWTTVPKDRGIAHWVVNNGRTALVNNVSNDARCGPDLDDDRKLKARSVLAAPVMSGGEVLGVLELINKRGGGLYAICDQKRLELMCRFDGELLAELARRAAEHQQRPETRAS